MYFVNLIPIAVMMNFTEKAGEAFVEAYFAGCFRVIEELQFSQFNIKSKEALKITSFLKDSPTLKVYPL